VRRLPWLVGALLPVLFVPAAARGDSPEANQAIELGRQALATYSRGAFEEALREFAAAEQVAHSPVFVLYMARCQRKLGKLLKARELLRRVTAENLAPDAPSPWQFAVASGRAELATLEGQIPSILVTITNPSEILGVTLDGATVDMSQGKLELDVDPGAHDLDVLYRDRTTERRVVVAGNGERSKLVALSKSQVRSRPAPSSASSALAHPAHHNPPDRRSSSLRRWSYVTLGASAVSLGAGVISGIVALNAMDNVKRRCSEDLKCRPEEAVQVERASDWAAVSTLSFIAAAGFLTVGTTAFVLSTSAGRDQVGLVARGSF
jgi:hypothetical protein